MDKFYTLLLFFWLFLSIVLGSSENIFRPIILGIIFGTYILSPIFVYYSKDETSTSSKNKALKFLLIYIILDLITGNSIPFDIFNGTFILSYSDLERVILAVMVSSSIIFDRLATKFLLYGYFFYLENVIAGIFYGSASIYVLIGLKTINRNLIFDLPLEEIFLISALSTFVLSILFEPREIPQKLQTQKTGLMAVQNILMPMSRIERIKNSSLKIGAIFLIFDFLKLTNEPIFMQIGWGFVIIFIFLAFFSGFIPSTNSSANQGLRSLIQGNIESKDLRNRINDYSNIIKDIDFKETKEIFLSPNEDVEIFEKGETKFTTGKGSLIVPTVSENGTTLVIHGKSKVEQTTSSTEIEEKVIDGTTTIFVSPKEWKDMKVKLIKKNVDQIQDSDLMNVGISELEELFSKTKESINKLKNWRGPEGLFSTDISEALNFNPSKYGVIERKGLTWVRFPGVMVFETPKMEIVNILGGFVKVINLRKIGEFVQIFGGFITVLSTKKYEFVNSPFFTVVDTPYGEFVRILGFDVQTGGKLNLEEVREEILKDYEMFNNLYSDKVQNIFNTRPDLLFSESEEGVSFGMIASEDEVLTDELIIDEIPEEIEKEFSKEKIKTDFTGRTLEVGNKSSRKKRSHQAKQTRTKEKINSIEQEMSLADQKLYDGLISEDKHSEIIRRLEKKKLELMDKYTKD